MTNSDAPLAIMGGAFDPVHFGHLRTAIELQERTGFSELYLVPVGRPSHRAAPVASAALRLQMLELAVQDLPWCRVDAREVRREGLSYSIDTLAEFRAQWPTRSLCLILGMDAFLGLPGWHRWTELAQFAHLIVAQRPGWSAQLPDDLQAWLQPIQVHSSNQLHREPAGRVLIQAVTALEIASSAIRDQIAAGRSPQFLLPDAALRLAQQSGCYGATNDQSGNQ